MGLVGRRLPDNVIPQELGEYSLFHDQPRPGTREGVTDEWFIRAPDGTLAALIPEIHTFTLTEHGLTVSPSIRLEHGNYYHGYLTEGIWH